MATASDRASLIVEAPLAADLASEIRSAADDAETEEDLKIAVESLLKDALRRLGVEAKVRYEKRVFHAGRPDALYSIVALEYKAPGKLLTKPGRESALDELKRYLIGLAKTPNVPRKFVGVAIDGKALIFVRSAQKAALIPLPTRPRRGQLDLFGGVVGDASRWEVEGPFPVSEGSVERLLLILRSLNQKILTAENLADEFGSQKQVARESVPLLYAKLREAMESSQPPKVVTLFEEWRRIFGIVYGEKFGQLGKASAEFAAQYGLSPTADIREVLFCVHTYFALLMKIFAAETLALQRNLSVPSSFAHKWAALDTDTLLREARNLEDGGIFRNFGITNFLEGDFFSWYLESWDEELSSWLRHLAQRLSEYEPATPRLEPSETKDLLKKLYQFLIPKSVRHDLGEYYTPDWLADLVLDDAGYKGQPGTTLLDPACGSGTFLTLAIGRMLAHWETLPVEFGKKPPPHEVERRVLSDKELQQILRGIVGYDINPIAVLAAKTNYIIALGRIPRTSGVEIPVYMADSVLTPTRYSILDERAKTSDAVLIRTAVGDFYIPRKLTDRTTIERVLDRLERSVTMRGGLQAFLDQVKESVPNQIFVDSRDALVSLYNRMEDLQAERRDGVWARIIKNNLAPLFGGEFDFVIGNPPWIRWGYLADEYRQATLPLWRDYGLFSLKGMQVRLGQGEKDFSMLFLYACSDQYLKTGGKLGFVITQEVFKSKGAGEGFRRFKLGKTGEPIRVDRVQDLVAIKPFEGAANKTAILTISKGSETTYPVPYIVWEKASRGAIDSDATLAEARSRCQLNVLQARPIHSKGGAWQTVSKGLEPLLAHLKGASAYKPRLGARVEPYGVFWLRLKEVRSDGRLIIENRPDLGEREVPPVTTDIEPDLVFPAVRGADLHRWNAAPDVYVLITQDPQTRKGIAADRMVRLERTYDYLCKFRDLLLTRGSKTVRELAERTVFWSMFGIGDYTFARYRVAWKRMASDLEAAVLSTWRTPFGERPLIATDTTSIISCTTENEAHYVCALLNSIPVRSYIKSFSSPGRGFGAPSILADLSLPLYDKNNELHRALVDLSREAHKLSCQKKPDLEKINEISVKVDTEAGRLYGLSEREVSHLRPKGQTKLLA